MLQVTPSQGWHLNYRILTCFIADPTPYTSFLTLVYEGIVDLTYLNTLQGVFKKTRRY